MQRTVSADLSLTVHSPARVVLSVAVARRAGLQIEETLHVSAGAQTFTPREIVDEQQGVFHTLDLQPGDYTVAYNAHVIGVEQNEIGSAASELTNLVPSRYAESDQLFGVAAERFNEVAASELVVQVRDWVAGRTAYISGSSRPTDGAVDTFLNGAGVCRDFAHLVIAILRARDVPARLVSAYAPGLDPMDFHAVVEAFVDGGWYVVDATGLAPRQSLLRIATGRDAADTSFMSSFGGQVDLTAIEVTATTPGDLMSDPHTGLLQLGR